MSTIIQEVQDLSSTRKKTPMTSQNTVQIEDDVEGVVHRTRAKHTLQAKEMNRNVDAAN